MAYDVSSEMFERPIDAVSTRMVYLVENRSWSWAVVVRRVGLSWADAESIRGYSADVDECYEQMTRALGRLVCA